jgi:hypothetical protein
VVYPLSGYWMVRSPYLGVHERRKKVYRYIGIHSSDRYT